MRGPCLLWAALAPLLAPGLAPADEARAARAVEQLGGRVTRDTKSPGKPVVSVDLGSTRVTDAGLKELAALTQLQTLDLLRTEVTDAGVKELAVLKQLRALNLGFTKVTDAGVKELAPLKQLQTLNLTNTKVTDAGVKELRKALPQTRIFR